MSTPRRHTSHSLEVGCDEPLIAVFLDGDDGETVVYFSSEEEVDRTIPRRHRQEALDLMGAWRDLDWDEMEQALDRIRHESPPSPPLSL